MRTRLGTAGGEEAKSAGWAVIALVVSVVILLAAINALRGDTYDDHGHVTCRAATGADGVSVITCDR